MVAAAAIALLSCNKTPLSVEKEEITSNGSRTVVFTTEMFESKTSISGNKTDGYKSDWSVGDRIDVFENGKVYTSEPLEASDIDNGIAHFTVNFDEVESASAYRYIAVYPSHYYEEGGDDGPILCSFETKANDWSFNDDYYFDEEEGYYFSLYMPSEQRPTAVSFDPNADLLISKEIIRENPVSEVESFQFARIGSMMKITLKGLDDYAGSKVENVLIEWDYYTLLHGWASYSSETEAYEFDGNSQYTNLIPDDTYIREDGTVDLWTRSFTGKEDTSMEIKLLLENDGKLTRFARFVDLESTGKKLEFKEGHLAEFSVGGFLLDDVNFEQEAIVFRNTPDGNSVVFSWVANEFVKEYECYIDNYPEYIDLGLAQVNDGIASISVPRSNLPENSFFFNYEVTAIDGHYTPRYSGYKQMNYYPNLLDGGVDDDYGSMYADNVKSFLGDIDLDFNTNYYYADGMHNEILGFRNVMLGYDGFLGYAPDMEPSSDGWKIWSVIPHKKMKGVKILMNDPDQATIESLHVYGASVPGGKDVELHISNIKTEDYLTYIYFDFDESSDLSYYTITSDSSLRIWSLTGLYDF